MVYGTIPQIRRLTGKLAIREHDIPLSPDLGDGSTVEFVVPQIGNNKGFFVDKDAAQTSTITTADVTVYVDGSPVTVSSLDEVKGSVILAVAPANATRVTADVTTSEVSDQMVIDKMNIVDEILDETLRGKGTAGQTYTQTEWGNGTNKTFKLHHYGITIVDTVTVNGTAQTLDTDFWEITYPRTSFIKEIVFSIAPIKDEENVVIEYTYGYTSYIIDRVAELMAARLLLLDMPSDVKSGRYRRGFDKGGTDMNIQPELSRLEMITRELHELRRHIDKTEKIRRV